MNSSSSVASSLQPHHRQELAVKVISKQEPVSHMARKEKVSFIIDELKIRETKLIKGIKSLRIALSNQKENLLAFAQVKDEKLANIAQRWKIPVSWVREVCLLMKKPLSPNLYRQKWNQLYKQLSEKFLQVNSGVEEAMKSTPRASSLVENLNRSMGYAL